MTMTEPHIVERLKRLERDNRRFKGLALTSLVFLFSWIIYACTTSRKVSAPTTAGTISAREFDVVDSSGKVRVKLTVSEPRDASSTAEISVLDSDSKERVVLNAIDSGFENLAFLDGKGNSALRITAGNIGSSEIDLYGGPSVGPLGKSPTGLGTQQMSLTVGADGRPSISLTDAQGSSMTLGSASLRKEVGQTQQTSAASILMFGKDKEHHVVWKAP
jgi:predicted nuclease of predicted toxin-antitoxin system